MSDHGIRNLDQLQEDEDRRISRGAAAALVALGGACVVFTGLALGGRTSQPQGRKSDPLGELVARRGLTPAASGSASRSVELSPTEVTFPHMLSDEGSPTTALAAVRASGSPPVVAADAPPPATDRLPVVPLPAQAVLEATPLVTRPRDALTKVAAETGQVNLAPTSSAEMAPSGHDGGYQLQVSSFRSQSEAEGFAEQLRARGHKAYVLEARVPGRGTWYRVRVGPFPTQHAATQYRAAFEQREHVVPFVVAPETIAKAH